MGLITKTVKMKWNGKTKTYYESLGYLYTKMGDEFEVKVEDLQKGSRIKVDSKCDGCGRPLSWSYYEYNSIVKNDGSTYCNICGKNLSKNGEAVFKSFSDWCIEHNRQDVLNRWDYELNNCSPKDITYGTTKKYYFKCSIHPEHESELKLINSFTNGQEGSITCNQCNSIAQYILDNFPNKSLYDVWDKSKNKELNPWKISSGSKKKVWIICQEKDYHDSYEINCYHFSKGVRCPYCVGQKIHAKDEVRKYVINNYGEEFLHKIWSYKNNVSPFEISPKNKKKVWWKCMDGAHEDYLRECSNSFAYNFRCPKCVNEMNNSIIEEKTRLYLESLNYILLHEHSCTLRPVNPKTKCPLPYDNEVILENGKHLIIEVHGAQHYNPHFYVTRTKCSKEEAEEKLKQRKLYDRYKKAYAEHYGYEYLELPYTTFNKKETYKQMIDDKIEEILHNTKAS